jgi:hypothetical protein
MRRRNAWDMAPGNHRVDFGRGLRSCSVLVTVASWSSFALTRISACAAVRGLSLSRRQAPVLWGSLWHILFGFTRSDQFSTA